jgi:hypothetical protein
MRFLLTKWKYGARAAGASFVGVDELETVP